VTDCPFCDRVERGEFDYDDRYSVAFRPLHPVTPGHFLVVPRRHHPGRPQPRRPVVA
jgi:diadenosine tetraphosphate (Ap4A) HIT family hydrolase